MTNVTKRQLALLLALTLLIAAIFCGCQSNENEILSRWKNTQANEYLEFFKDGTFNVSEDPEFGNYFINENQITVFMNQESIRYTFEIEGDELTLYNSVHSGISQSFKKVSGFQSNENEILGRWKPDGYSNRYTEFFNDGTYSVGREPEIGNYSINENQLKLTYYYNNNKSNFTTTLIFEIEDNVLTLYLNNGNDVQKYEKVN